MLHNILNSNITGYASILISISSIIFMETKAEVWDKKSKHKQQDQ